MQLGQVLRCWRQKYDVDMRTAAREMGITPSTLCRIEADNSVNSDTLAKVLLWLIGAKKK